MRRKDREMPPEFALTVADKCEYAVISMTDISGEPYCVPVTIARDGNAVYFHSAKEGKKLDLLRKDDHVCFEMDYDHEMIPAKYACAYNFRYASVVGRGHCEIITDVDEKIKALELLMKHQTGEDFVMEAKHTLAVEILKITVEEFTGKRRFKK